MDKLPWLWPPTPHPLPVAKCIAESESLRFKRQMYRDLLTTALGENVCDRLTTRSSMAPSLLVAVDINDDVDDFSLKRLRCFSGKNAHSVFVSLSTVSDVVAPL